MSANLKRHAGKLLNTDQRVVVVMMQIPGREDHALVCPTDTLPPRYEQAVRDLLESNEGQSEEMFANLLSRRFMPDTGRTVLQTLHEENRLIPVPVSQVVMLPHPARPFPLEQILAAMGRKVPASTATTNAVAPPMPVAQPQAQALAEAALPQAKPPTTEKFNPHVVNQQAHVSDQNVGTAKNLLIEAEMLEADAQSKRSRAYAMAPSLRPAAAEPTVVAQPVAPGDDMASALAEVLASKPSETTDADGPIKPITEETAPPTKKARMIIPNRRRKTA